MRLLKTDDLTKINFQQLPSSITAISQTSPILNGQVNLNTPDVDINRGLVQLPVEVVDAAGLINQNFCAVTAGTGSSFTITGRGGLSSSPDSQLSSDTVWEDWQLTTVQHDHRPTTAKNFQLFTPKRATPEPIVEANSWVKNEKGEIELTATPPTVTPLGLMFNPPSCHS
ncbi:hypothetical protein NIES2101_17885 [Calothrix sp. HK-06]|nr:hypothetical protein NIES2101_17885 [Calothrix sp. HK-06]